MNASVIAAAVLLCCVPVVALGQTATKPSPSTPVTVVNDASNPVPVKGAVTGTITGSVEVTNGVSNAVPVQVTNGANSPVQVTGAVAVVPALLPVQKSALAAFQTGDRFSNDVVLYTVPAGKVLVLETVTVGANLASADRFLHADIEVGLDAGGLPFRVIVQPTSEGIFSSTGASIFNKTQAVTAYAGPGTTVVASGVRDGTTLSSTAVLFSIAGHLVEAP